MGWASFCLPNFRTKILVIGFRFVYFAHTAKIIPHEGSLGRIADQWLSRSQSNILPPEGSGAANNQIRGAQLKETLRQVVMSELGASQG